MNTPMIAPMRTQVRTPRWNGLALVVLVAATVHLTAATNASRIDEPWPMLLSSEPANIDPGIAALQQRAHGSLDRLVQSARAPERPL
jgi:hypothetical protein